MFKLQGIRVFSSMLLAAALTGCGPIDEAPSAPLSEDGQIAEITESVSIVSGYDLRLPGTGPYTLTGYVMPRWTAPSTHNQFDYITLAQEGSAVGAYIAWQYVGGAGATFGVGDQIVLPATLNTGVKYEMRYFLSNGTLAAKTPSFNVQAIPALACGTNFSGTDVPSVHRINVGKPSGTVSFYHEAYSIKDRFLVYSGNSLLFDSGCNSGGQTIPITYSNANSVLRVVVMSTCEGDSGTGFDFNVGCAI
ncbi:MAG TPA: hypothetical protein VEU33_31900 [Archangium sp.]|nr:hypothetical protein [Archangium sp.]